MINLVAYQSIRPQIKTGDILALSGNGWLSKAIQWRTKSEYSHVAMLLRLLFHHEERIMLAHAVYPAGVVFVHASTYLQSYRGRADLYQANHDLLWQEDPEYAGRFADYLALQAGRKYDISGVLRFVLPFVKNSASAFFCSELAASVYRNLGLMNKTAISPGKFVSHDLFIKKVPLD